MFTDGLEAYRADDILAVAFVGWVDAMPPVAFGRRERHGVMRGFKAGKKGSQGLFNDDRGFVQGAGGDEIVTIKTEGAVDGAGCRVGDDVTVDEQVGGMFGSYGFSQGWPPFWSRRGGCRCG